MWEPGFLAERIPWLVFLRSVNLGWLFSAIGMQPIENELHVRPFVSVAFAMSGRHGDLPVRAVFLPSSLERLPESVRTLGDLLCAKHFQLGRSRVKLTEIAEPYRKELLEMTRRQIEEDLNHFETLQRNGASIYLAPEGFYSGDGKMQRFRGALPRLAPVAEIWLAGISYDPFVDRRLSMLYRVAAAEPEVPFDVQLKRLRPVTVSAVLGSWVYQRPERPFTFAEARDAVAAALRDLPSSLFVEPELRRDPQSMVRSALAGMLRLGITRSRGDGFELAETRVHPQFPRTSDIVAYQFNFHQETLQGAHWGIAAPAMT